MYIIIGGDGKEYGPISGDDVRKWILEKRLNGQSRAKAEGEAEFRSLSTFSEFTDLFQPSVIPPPFSPGGGTRDGALQLVKGPAIALKITAIVGLVAVACGFAMNIASLAGHPIIPQQPMPDPQMQKIFTALGGWLGLVQDAIGVVIAVIVWIGAGRMQRLENYQFAMTAAVVGMVPCISPCCVLGIPFGIWALIVLNKPEVKPHFS
jgi:hypothetical protein